MPQFVTLTDEGGTERRVNPDQVVALVRRPESGTTVHLNKAGAPVRMAEDIDTVEAMLMPLEIRVGTPGPTWEDIPEMIETLREHFEANGYHEDTEASDALVNAFVTNPESATRVLLHGTSEDIAALSGAMRATPERTGRFLADEEVTQVVDQPPLGGMEVGTTGDLQDTVDEAQEIAHEDDPPTGLPVLLDMGPWLALHTAVDEDRSADYIADYARSLCESTWVVQAPDAIVLPPVAIDALNAAYASHPSTLTDALDSAIYDVLKCSRPGWPGSPRKVQEEAQQVSHDRLMVPSALLGDLLSAVKGLSDLTDQRAMRTDEVEIMRLIKHLSIRVTDAARYLTSAEEVQAAAQERFEDLRILEPIEADPGEAEKHAQAYVRDRYGMRPLTKVVVVECPPPKGPWQGLYIDGALVASDRRLAVEEVIDRLPLDTPLSVAWRPVDLSWWETQAALPADLDAVVLAD